MKPLSPTLSRRKFLAALSAAALTPNLSRKVLRAESPGRAPDVLPRAGDGGEQMMYAGVGPEMVAYAVNVSEASLKRMGATSLPANIQYAWPHPSQPLLYIASSNQAGAAPGDRHQINAFAVDPRSGALQPHGEPAQLRNRPVNITVDPAGKFLLTAYPNPSGLTVHTVLANGELGGEVRQPAGLDYGVYAHQVRVTPANDRVVLVTRGNDPAPKHPEDPGALKVFDYHAGLLGQETSIAPGNGLGFGPRHLDFHPTQPWAFVAQERENVLAVYDLQARTPALRPLSSHSTLSAAKASGAVQTASAVHVHPNGRFVYVMNRATGTVDVDGSKVFSGGENSVAVFALNLATGEPRLIQSIDTRGWSARTFSLDASGRILVVANQSKFWQRTNGRLEAVPASLAIFRVAREGTLEYAGKEVLDVGTNSLFWNGFVRAG